MAAATGTRAARTEAKREAIVETAMRAFAENGYQGARIEDIAAELSIAKGSVFQYFGSKEGLFLAAYKRAVEMLPAWLDAPAEVIERGFFATLRYWLEQTEHLMREDWIPTRVTLIGNYGTDLSLKREINRFLAGDPYGTGAFVDFGMSRGELRRDIDRDMIVSMIDWMNERFQDEIVADELDPGLFARGTDDPSRRAHRIDQFMKLIVSAVGKDARGPRTDR
jgi:TetR/AcrR family transcriptional regulator